MTIRQKRAVAGVSIGLTVWLGIISMAIADPGGWAVWRVALCSWWIAVSLGGIAATFPFFEDTTKEKQRGPTIIR